MKFLTTLTYFIFVIILLAGIGVIIPLIFDIANDEKNIYKNLNQNLVTYFIAIAITSSLDYVLKIIDDNVKYRKLAILIAGFLNFLILGMAGYVIYQNIIGTYSTFIPWQIYVGIIFSSVTWWMVNHNNSNFNPTSSLGGDTTKTLSNG